MSDIYEGAFFGRRKGKALRAAQAERLNTLLPRFAVDLERPAPDPLSALFPKPVIDITLEIGFGGGEHMVHRAGEAPSSGIIGVEPFVNGMVKALAAIEEKGLENIRLYDDDAIDLLDWLPAASIDRAYLLYPDPWPKKRHWKRRFVGPANLDCLARVLKPGAEFRFASDIDTYVDWTLRHLRAHEAFEWTAECAADWREAWAGWPGTRYEVKAIREGRRGYYLTFRRI
ncbi:tRNA (guanine(46)-N(7))-methyltransferase TrmB [Breoghania sp.]|uniref:tRNA (guanine(46)-N(7))-methyltransferase TrmB n=1 Tax=Breoghania sp. TaxID=2065378 RepID=UPI002620BB1A|nr:tRNA (guanine(46)-N(7))-methyltransferase TrmB [Breoghania sp.]MDJ0930871.1 tRNA (guanine(46)-N(7))-methyltransferase TrmB [Breoghania sp.]